MMKTKTFISFFAHWLFLPLINKRSKHCSFRPSLIPRSLFHPYRMTNADSRAAFLTRDESITSENIANVSIHIRYQQGTQERLFVEQIRQPFSEIDIYWTQTRRRRRRNRTREVHEESTVQMECIQRSSLKKSGIWSSKRWMIL